MLEDRDKCRCSRARRTEGILVGNEIRRGRGLEGRIHALVDHHSLNQTLKNLSSVAGTIEIVPVGSRVYVELSAHISPTFISATSIRRGETQRRHNSPPFISAPILMTTQTLTLT